MSAGGVVFGYGKVSLAWYYVCFLGSGTGIFKIIGCLELPKSRLTRYASPLYGYSR